MQAQDCQLDQGPTPKFEILKTFKTNLVIGKGWGELSREYKYLAK